MALRHRLLPFPRILQERNFTSDSEFSEASANRSSPVIPARERNETYERMRSPAGPYFINLLLGK